ncbi:MAG: damage-inducible protein DinB [Opitutaceae bacterium]|nr:damage-inducible protein DinB [Cytophagales bacterium]
MELTEIQTATVITHAELLHHWLGHRALTRRVIAAFPEKELLEFSIGGMRTFAGMVIELLAIGAPGLKQMAGGETEPLNENVLEANSKANILQLWDEATELIKVYWDQIPEDRFHDKILAFGQYEGTIWFSIFYFIDNEIHHRAQGTVYLRSIGITPPYFYER